MLTKSQLYVKRFDLRHNYLRTFALQRYKRLMRWLMPGNHNYNRFVILSSPRSGSTLLHTYLNSSINILSIGEQPWRDIESGLEWDYFGIYPDLIKAVGFKVFYQFATDLPYQKIYHELMGEKNLKVIHLIRENKLEQYISHVLAWQKREWTLKRETKFPEKITLDIERFEQYMSEQRSQAERCVSDFDDQRILTISYKSLVDEPQKTLLEVQHFLEVPKRQLFSLLEKQSTKPLHELLHNREEVRIQYPQYFE